MRLVFVNRQGAWDGFEARGSSPENVDQVPASKLNYTLVKSVQYMQESR